MAYSTFANPNYFRSNFEDTTSYDIINTDGTVSTIKELDPYGTRLHDFVNSLTQYDSIQYNGEQFTTTVYKYYGNTTLIWLVLMYNGLVSRTELRAGMILKFPTVAAIEAARITNSLAVRGQVVI